MYLLNRKALLASTLSGENSFPGVSGETNTYKHALHNFKPKLFSPYIRFYVTTKPLNSLCVNPWIVKIHKINRIVGVTIITDQIIYVVVSTQQLDIDVVPGLMFFTTRAGVGIL